MKGIIERALELAVDSASVGEVKQKLKAEGYEQIDAHLSGRLIRRQIIEDYRRVTRSGGFGVSRAAERLTRGAARL